MNDSGAMNGGGWMVLPVLFPFLFVAVWVLVCMLVSRLSGWSRLAERFRCEGRPEGKVFRMAGARLGLVGNYNGVLTIVAGREGLYMAVFPLFRMGHPPVLVPWNEIHDVRRTKLLGCERVEFRVCRPEILAVSVSRRVGDAFPGMGRV